MEKYCFRSLTWKIFLTLAKFIENVACLSTFFLSAYDLFFSSTLMCTCRHARVHTALGNLNDNTFAIHGSNTGSKQPPVS